jgi:retinol dehydrogenase-14
MCLIRKTLVVGVCRSKSDVLSLLQLSYPKTLKVYLCDLSSLKETHDCTVEIFRDNPSISVLVNNAGVYSETRCETSEKIERTIAVNVLAPTLLSLIFLGQRKSGGREILNISSVGEKYGVPTWEDLQSLKKYSGNPVYNFSKLWLTLITYYLAQNNPGTLINSLHPGATSSHLIKSSDIQRMPLFLRIVFRFVSRFRKSPEKAASHILDALGAIESQKLTSSYFNKSQLSLSSKVSLDKGHQERAFLEAQKILTSILDKEFILLLRN